jgi:hypothetical protein
MSEDGSEDVREAFAMKSEVEGWQCVLCTNQIAYEDREVFFTTGLCSRCRHRAQRDS